MRLAASLLILLPTFGLAECPTGDDLNTGIWVYATDNSAEFYQAGDNNVVSILTYFDGDDQAALETLLVHGLYVMSYADLEDGNIIRGSQSNYVYPDAYEALPLPTPGGSWSSEIAIFEGGAIESDKEDMIFGQMTEMTIGDCTYDMFTVLSRYQDAEPETLFYLPDLGLSLLDLGQDESGTPITYTSIESD